MGVGAKSCKESNSGIGVRGGRRGIRDRSKSQLVSSVLELAKV